MGRIRGNVHDEGCSKNEIKKNTKPAHVVICVIIF